MNKSNAFDFDKGQKSADIRVKKKKHFAGLTFGMKFFKTKSNKSRMETVPSDTPRV